MTTLSEQIYNSNPRAYEDEMLTLDVTEAICTAMKDDRCTRTELAKRLGTTTSKVSRWLNGQTRLHTNNIAKIMLALGRRATIKVERI